MNFKSIDYFLTVAQTRSITKAAAQLHITQQTLSADIAALERELGQPLFLRRVPLQLTYAGEVFRRYAQAFRQTHHAMVQEFCDISDNQTGILHVGVTYARGHALMPQLIANFQTKYPNISVHLVEDSHERLKKHLLEGTVDLAIAGFPNTPGEIELVPFYQEELVLLLTDSLLHTVYGSDSQKTLQQLQSGNFGSLAHCPFVLGMPDDIGINIGLQFLKHQRLQPPVKAQSENLDTVLALCARDVGACFSPANLIPGEFSSFHVIPLPNAAYQIYFGMKKGAYQWNMIDAFIQTAKGG